LEKLVKMELTSEQKAVVAHNHGPAVVIAVAGAGKTTTMTHRIHRLVSEGIFAPQRILACVFGKENQQDLEKALKKWPITRGVHTQTVHSLGFSIIREAKAMKPAWGVYSGGIGA
jgi:DNA helicase II / ATP-dependent DNA helicase PcrA